MFAVADFARWVRNNTVRHKVAGYAIGNISLKPVGGIPGDATSEQMRVVAKPEMNEGLTKFGWHRLDRDEGAPGGDR